MPNSIFDKLKKRWGVRSNFQVLIILTVFACTGFSVLYVKSILYYLLGIDPPEAIMWRILFFLIITLPEYQVLLLFYGFLFGQFRFFWNFEKKMFARILQIFSTQKKKEKQKDNS